MGTEKTTHHGREVFVAEAPPCDDEAACAFELRIDGRRYVGTGERPATCTGDVVAITRGERIREVRRTTDDDRYALCSPDGPRRDWETVERFEPSG